jgi:SAM-dependent methyltransferase
MTFDFLPASLARDADGVWHAGANVNVSYPEDGDSLMVEVEESSFWFHHRNRCILSAMERLPPHGAVVDIGAGNGFVALAMQNAGIEVLIIEPGHRAAATARRRGIKEVVCGTLEDAGFAEDSFPAAGLFDVLEHLSDDRASLATIRKLLCADGRIYITVPSYQFLFSEEDYFAGHFRRYSLGSLARLVENAGFRIEYATYFFAFLPLPILLRRTIPTRLKLGKPRPRASQVVADHSLPHPFESIIERLLRAELAAIRAGRRIPVGSSCLLVAKKT